MLQEHTPRRDDGDEVAPRTPPLHLPDLRPYLDAALADADSLPSVLATAQAQHEWTPNEKTAITG
jgi:hypothetical protein